MTGPGDDEPPVGQALADILVMLLLGLAFVPVAKFAIFALLVAALASCILG